MDEKEFLQHCACTMAVLLEDTSATETRLMWAFNMHYTDWLTVRNTLHKHGLVRKKGPWLFLTEKGKEKAKLMEPTFNETS